MITAYIDGDWIMYAAGFAGQKNKYVCPEIFGRQEFNTKTAMKDELLKVNDPECRDLREIDTDEYPVYSRVVMDPDSHFYHSAKNMIEKNCLKIAEKFGDEVTPVLLLDGDGNFRTKIATIKPYKGNRVSGKPLFYNNLRQYLLDVWDAEVVDDMETDDEMAIRQTASSNDDSKSIIVAVDKDMLQVPGWHMNPNKGFKFIHPKEAVYRQYHQCIMGDATDNIGGCYKAGPAAATRVLKGCNNEKRMWNVTVTAYQQSIDKYDNHYNGLNAVDAATENMRLIYLRRTRNYELWNPKSLGG